MRTLYLVRHGPVAVDPALPSADWPLADGSEAAIALLATRLRHARAIRLISSFHVKATQTAEILAENLNLPVIVRDGLEEHHRKDGEFFSGPGAFEESMRRFFEQPNDVVLGLESAYQARDRFKKAINEVMAEGEGDEVIVAHGAVMALYLEGPKNGNAKTIWKDLKQPDLLAVSWPDLTIARQT